MKDEKRTLRAAIGRLEDQMEAHYSELEGADESRRILIETHIQNTRSTLKIYRDKLED